MPRITVNIDLDNNEILGDEIKKAIKASVVSYTREFIDQIVNEEVNRIISVREKAWTENNRWGNPLRSELNKKIDAAIVTTFSNLSTTGCDVQNRIDAMLKKQNADFVDMFQHQIEKSVYVVATPEFIEKIIREMIPVQTLDLLTSLTSKK